VPPPAPSAPAAPYLEGALRERFDRWLEEAVERTAGALTPRELRVGVQALSSLYVERRAEGRLATRALDGAGKRAAFATYYAALHFLVAHHALREAGPGFAGVPRAVLDLGCGTGAAGAAVALTLAAPRAPDLLGVDRSGWALGEARRACRSLGLRGRTRRADLPAGLGRPGGGRLALLAWSANELDEPARESLCAWLAEHAGRGGSGLVLEPLAGPAAPWWPDWCERLASSGAASGALRTRVSLPAWIARLDRAAGLDHTVLGARWLALPPGGSGGRRPRASRGPGPGGSAGGEDAW